MSTTDTVIDYLGQAQRLFDGGHTAAAGFMAFGGLNDALYQMWKHHGRKPVRTLKTTRSMQALCRMRVVNGNSIRLAERAEEVGAMKVANSELVARFIKDVRAFLQTHWPPGPEGDESFENLRRRAPR
ncbi:MAG: hypothetical protein ACYTG0_17785 [Planctomycetota bacterium]|jgi:hypothetical protein